MSNFLQRLTFGSILGAVLCVAIYFSNDPVLQPLFVLLIGIGICGALWEYYQISKGSGSHPVASLGIIGSLCYLVVIYLTLGNPAFVDWPWMTLGLILFVAFLSYFISGISPFINLAVTIFGVVYLTVPLSSIIAINLLYGRFWILYLFLVTKLTDIVAYFVGKQFGRHPLAPVISPKKTWEGALGGFFAGVFTSYLMHKISLALYGQGLFDSSLQSLWFGGLMSIIAQIGDLSESLLKRDSGVKDSSQLPGLGGLLDMVDSLVFTAPLLYFYLKLGSHP